MTKYRELKEIRKSLMQWRRIVKNHRKTVRFQGERLKNIEVYHPRYVYENEVGYVLADYELQTIPELTAQIATDIANYGFRLSPYPENLDELNTIQALLKSERKGEDISKVPEYWLKRMDEWRD